MNDKISAIREIENFLKSSDKCLLLTGTHIDEKHKLIMAVLDHNYKEKLILFRAPSLPDIDNEHILGWVDIDNRNRKQFLNGGKRRIGKNIYECDGISSPSSWHHTSYQFEFAICLLGKLSHDNKRQIEAIDNLFKDKQVRKIFLVTNVDPANNNYAVLNKYNPKMIAYDAEADNPDKHNHILDMVNNEGYEYGI